MCATCMMGAATAATGATGARIWLRAHLSPRALRIVTPLLIVAALLAASVAL